MYNRITLLYRQNYHNIVNELYFNKTLKKDKKYFPLKREIENVFIVL